MSSGEDLVKILNGTAPKGSMMVATKHNSDSVELYGTNGNGFKILIAELDKFISQLKEADQNAMNVFAMDDFEVMVPGHKIQRAIFYLNQAKTLGVKLGEYKQIF